MAHINSCTQFGNYSARKLHYTGLKFNPYDWTLHGIRRANGQTYVGDLDAPQPAPQALATSLPNCRTCHSGC